MRDLAIVFDPADKWEPMSVSWQAHWIVCAGQTANQGERARSAHPQERHTTCAMRSSADPTAVHYQ